jgi:hypothetical protein
MEIYDLPPCVSSCVSQQFFYEFGKQGKVSVLIITTDLTGTPPEIDWKTNTVTPGILPGSANAVNVTGRYKQYSNSIHLDFSDLSIDATINGNRMEGETTNKKTNQKAKWMATRASEASNSMSATVRRKSSSNGDSSATTNINPSEMKAKLNAYLGRAGAKLQQQDYQGAIADFTQLLQLCAVVIEDFEKTKKPLIEEDCIEKKRVKGSGAGDVAARAIISERDEKTILKSWADIAAQMGYHQRGTAKSNLGDKVGACEDFRMSCILGFGPACESLKNICN